MSKSVGAQLRDARNRRKMSIDDVAHETRIPISSIRALENDDYSSFANLTYAKSFLSLYSRFLNVDVSSVLSQFQTGATDITEHRGPLGYLSPAENQPYRTTPKRSSVSESRGGPPVLMFLILVALIGGIGYALYHLSQGSLTPPAGVAPESQEGDTSPENTGSTSEAVNPSGTMEIDPGPLVPEDPTLPQEEQNRPLGSGIEMEMSSEEEPAVPAILPEVDLSSGVMETPQGSRASMEDSATDSPAVPGVISIDEVPTSPAIPLDSVSLLENPDQMDLPIIKAQPALAQEEDGENFDPAAVAEEFLKPADR